MGDKKKISGWMRLWIVGSSIWAIYAIALAAGAGGVETVGLFLLIWLLPCVGTFLLGNAIGWIYRGFDEDFRRVLGETGGESGQPGEPHRKVSLIGAAVSAVRRLFL